MRAVVTIGIIFAIFANDKAAFLEAKGLRLAIYLVLHANGDVKAYGVTFLRFGDTLPCSFF